MSEDTRVTGEIRIDPPITWGELHDERWALAGDRDAVVRVETEEVDTPEGLLAKHRGVAIIPERQDQSAYHLTEHVQAIVDRFGRAPDGTPIRTFTGHLECVWAGGEEMWRVVVEDGQAKRVKPIFVWPGDEDLVRRIRSALAPHGSATNDEQVQAIIAALAGGTR